MTAADSVRVYINGRGVEAPVAAAALDAVRLWDPQVAAEIAAGTRALADSRGLPLDPATQVFGGLIMRVVANRGNRREADA